VLEDQNWPFARQARLATAGNAPLLMLLTDVRGAQMLNGTAFGKDFFVVLSS
jgi:hypothetical protein